MGGRGRAAKGDYSRNAPSWEDVETPLSGEKGLHCILLHYQLRPQFFSFQKNAELCQMSEVSLSHNITVSASLETDWPRYLSWVSAPLQMNLLQWAPATRVCYCRCVISSPWHYCLGVLCPWGIIKPCTSVFQGMSYRNKRLLKEAIGHSKSMLDIKLVPVSVAFVFVCNQ